MSWQLSRSRKSGQDDKSNFCLTAAIIAVNRRDHEKTPPRNVETPFALPDDLPVAPFESARISRTAFDRLELDYFDSALLIGTNLIVIYLR